MVAALAATLVNPYGWEMLAFLQRTLVPRPEIVEWQAVPIQSREGLAYLLIVALGIFGLWTQPWRRRVMTAPLVMVGVLLPLSARRHLPLLVLIVLFTCAGDAARALGAAIERRWPRMEQPSSGRLRPLIAAALIVESIVILALARTEWTHIPVDRTGYPIAAVERLAQIREPANLAVFFDWGEYVLWHVGPRIKISVDGRRETVYPDAIYTANGAFTDGVGDWARLLRDYPTDLALVDVDTPAASLMALRPDWELILRDGPAALYARRGSSLAAALRDAPTSTSKPALATFP